MITQYGVAGLILLLFVGVILSITGIYVTSSLIARLREQPPNLGPTPASHCGPAPAE